MEISSLQNPKIKNLIKLQEKSRERKKSGLFAVEGKQENFLAIQNGFKAEQFFIQEDLFSNEFPLPSAQKFTVTKDVFQKLAYRSTTGGIIGVFQSRSNDLEKLSLMDNPLIAVLEAVEKPGNLGAVLRTADAVNADAVVICDVLADFYNPNVIRSSVGTVFTNNLISCTKEELVSFCKKNKIQILATYLRKDTEELYDLDLNRSTAFIFGTEATGLSDFWLKNSDKTVKIPMNGQVDSLNVSNAVAVCLYEALRQRRSGR